MPRIHINVQDIDDIEDLQEQEDWELQLGLAVPTQRPETRDRFETQRYGQRRVQRLSGAEALDRKRSERRKQVVRGGRRD